MRNLVEQVLNEDDEADYWAYVNKVRRGDRLPAYTKQQIATLEKEGIDDNDKVIAGRFMTLQDLIKEFGDYYRDEMDADNPNFKDADFIDMIEADRDVYQIKPNMWFIV